MYENPEDRNYLEEYHGTLGKWMFRLPFATAVCNVIPSFMPS